MINTKINMGCPALFLTLMLVFFSALQCGLADAQEVGEIEDRYSEIIRDADIYRNIPSNIEIRPDLITRIMRGNLSEVLTIDSDSVHRHFTQNPGDQEKENDVNKWGAGNLSPFDVPFYIDSGQRQTRIVVSDELLRATDSIFTFYVTFFKAFQNLNEELSRRPSALTYGICGLIAQEVTYRTNMASSINFDLESAMVNLIYLFKPDALWDAFRGGERFNWEAYREGIASALSEINGTNIDGQRKNVDDLFQWGLAESTYEKLLTLLPVEENRNLNLVNRVSRSISNLTNRFLLINAFYDRIINNKIINNKRGQEPKAWFYDILKRQGSEFSDGPVLQDDSERELFENIRQCRQDLFDAFDREYEERSRHSQSNRLNYDPFALKWLVAYLYNYSWDLAEKNSAYTKEGGRLEDLAEKSVLPRIQSDELLHRVISIAGRPRIEVRRRGEDQLWLDWRWYLRRINMDQEMLRIRIFDSFGGGGGKPVPGVHPESTVKVRRTLESTPEEIALGEVEEGFFIESIDQWENTVESRLTWVRVFAKNEKRTKSIYTLSSGDHPLKVADLQGILAKEKQTDWRWYRPDSLKPHVMYLLGKEPIGPVALDANNLQQENASVIVLTLAKRSQPAYFANSRLVNAKTEPPDIGIDAHAMIDIPDGQTELSNIASGDKVKAFKPGQPDEYITKVHETESVAAKYYITIAYTLPGGGTGGLKVGEDQALFVYQDNRITILPARDLQLNDQLIHAFRGRGSAPLTATITGLKGEKRTLGVYTVVLRNLGIIRANDILVPVQYVIEISDGLRKDTQAQLAPAGIRDASKRAEINLKGVGTEAAEQLRTGTDLLAYKAMGGSAYFYRGRIAFTKPVNASRYLKITAGNAALNLGHLQKVYFIPSGGTVVMIDEARSLKEGYRLLKLKKYGFGKNSRVEEVVIDRIEDIHPLDGEETMFLIGYSPETEKSGMYSHEEMSDYFANMFANGFLVRLEPTGSARGMGSGGTGPNTGAIPSPEALSKTNLYMPSMDGVIRDVDLPEPRVLFNKKDLVAFDENLRLLDSIDFSRNYRPQRADSDRLFRFLSKYYRMIDKAENEATDNRAYDQLARKVYANLKKAYVSYRDIRALFINTGEIEIAPALINEYQYLTHLLYEAGEKRSGDILTRDILTILFRTMEKSGGSLYYNEDKLAIRSAVISIRDMLLYIRDRNTTRGLRPSKKVTFSSAGWSDILPVYTRERGLSEDIIENPGEVPAVNLYNLYTQMDKWASRSWTSSISFGLPESIYSPSFDPAMVLRGDKYEKSFRIIRKRVDERP